MARARKSDGSKPSSSGQHSHHRPPAQRGKAENSKYYHRGHPRKLKFGGFQAQESEASFFPEFSLSPINFCIHQFWQGIMHLFPKSQAVARWLRDLQTLAFRWHCVKQHP